MGEKSLPNIHLDRRLIFRIYKELKVLNSKRENNSNKKWAVELSRSFSNEEV
jgi:hypothetical protein